MKRAAVHPPLPQPSRPRRAFTLGLALALVACSDPSWPAGLAGRDILTPEAVQTPVRFTDIGAGWFHTCGTGTDAIVYCWGKNEFGELGAPDAPFICNDFMLGEVPCTGTPQPVRHAPPLHMLTGSVNHTCGLAPDGQAWCWGMNGILGDGIPPDERAPICPNLPWDATGRACRPEAAPVAGDDRFSALNAAVGGSVTCGVATDGALACWGSFRPIGMGQDGSNVPTRLDTSLPFTAIAVENLFACGLAGSAAWCWGSNWYGTLGTGGPTPWSRDGDSAVPVAVVGGHNFTQIVLSLSHVCGLRTDGQAWCWGELPATYGHGADRYGATPVFAGGPAFTSLAGGGNHVCGISVAGEAWCWGANDSGFLGDGTRRERRDPTRVRMPAGVVFRQLALGGVHSCGLSADGRVFCWGFNGHGQAGQDPAQRR
jgi:alpha-tubulin suppressor-like RCC1 family protein